jgi:hypothetical protein
MLLENGLGPPNFGLLRWFPAWMRGLLAVVLGERSRLLAELEERDLPLRTLAHAKRHDGRANSGAHVDGALRVLGPA